MNKNTNSMVANVAFFALVVSFLCGMGYVAVQEYHLFVLVQEPPYTTVKFAFSGSNINCQELGKSMKSTETCNNADDNGNGCIDEGFDFQNDAANCGICGRSRNPGLECKEGHCLEQSVVSADDLVCSTLVICDDSVCFGE